MPSSIAESTAEKPIDLVSLVVSEFSVELLPEQLHKKVRINGVIKKNFLYMIIFS